MELKAYRNEITGRWSLNGVEPSEHTLNRMINMIRSGENFKFARFGDGEFNCMFGKRGTNCDGHEYFKDLGERLSESFSKEIMIGIQPLALTLPYREKILDKVVGMRLYNSDVLHNASIDLELSRFMKEILDSGRKNICVGPVHLLMMFDRMIIIPDKNCWTVYEGVKKQLEEWISENENSIIFLCASMMSEVLIHDFRSAPVTIIDAGSVFDPYVGRVSRKYHQKLIKK